MSKNEINISTGLNCPIPKSDYENVLLAHGGGGTLTHQLLDKMFFPNFSNDILNVHHDSAILNINNSRIAFTTDSYVVNPIFFPGGNIGDLAVYGTINDLAVAGAKPLYISVSFIIEEGLPMDDLWQIVLSIKSASIRAGVQIVTGDTKVVDRGKGDKIFINTSGIGLISEGINISPQNCKPGDLILLNGSIAEHGITIMSSREGLEFDTEIKSDTAPLNSLIAEMLDTSKNIHVMRDPTRGGIASTLNEIASTSNLGIQIYEDKIPIEEEVLGACEILGLDPLYIANEGKLLAFVDKNDAQKVLDAMRKNEFGKRSQIIGEVTENNPGTVVMKTSIGSNRIVDMISGEQLPRIC